MRASTDDMAPRASYVRSRVSRLDILRAEGSHGSIRFFADAEPTNPFAARPVTLCCARVSPSSWFRILLVAFLWLSASRGAFAHQSSVVYCDITEAGRDVQVTLQLSNGDLYEALGLEKDPAATIDETRAGMDRIVSYLAARIAVTNHGQVCPGEPLDHAITKKAGGFFFVQQLRYHCRRSLEEAELTYNLFFDLDPRHQGLCRVRAFGGESEHVFRAQSRTLHLGRPLGIIDHVRDYLWLGVEHIFTGYDHLAFLLGLLIIAAGAGMPLADDGTKSAGMRRGLGYVVRIVTAFTVAHSLTLCAAALGWFLLSSWFVESFIAVSIGYVALENILFPAPRHRFLVTFCFGLVHGFGFATVLKEIGLPQVGLLWSLLSFNIGVELGQLSVVVLGFPVLYLLARHTAIFPSQTTGTRKTKREPQRRSGPPFRPLEVLLLTVLLGLCVLLFVRCALPLPTVCVIGIALPLALLWLVPRYGYDRCVRIGLSALLLSLSVLWLVERSVGKQLVFGWLG